MYTRVESRFWTDERIRAVSQEARYLMLYLLTNPHRNMLGLYYLPPAYACHDLGWPEKRFQERLEELLQKGVIQYDGEPCVVWVINYLKHNPLANPNQVKAALAVLDELPKNALYKPFYEHLKRFAKPLYEPLLKRLEERFQEPFRNKDQDQDQDQNKNYNYPSTETVIETVPQKAKEKIHYAEFVMLTEEEYAQLVADYGEELTRRSIEILDNYKGSTGKRYKSDYRTILNWVISRAQKERAEGRLTPPPKPRKEIKLPPCGCRAGLTAVKDAQGRIEAIVCKQCGAPQVRYE